MAEHGPDTFLPREQTLSETQLRHLYEEEEVERFLSLFSAYVTEFRLSTGVASAGSTDSQSVDNVDAATGNRPAERSLSEHIAYSYLLPYMSPVAGVAPAFTLRRLNLVIQRLYLALFPPYRAFFSNLAHLALWKDYQRSLRYCILFWFLWFHDLLLPALLFRIVFGLLRHRVSAYPTLKELQERRQETVQALKFGEAVRQRLSTATLGPIELWHLFRLYKSEEESKAMPMSKDAIETDEDFKREMLHALNQLADLHERIKNIFTWRRSDVSRRYLFFLIVVGFISLVLPARCATKLVYWCGGILFWHVIPVVRALRQEDRARLVSLLFRDAPTDIEYAMELIAQRIAAGQEVGLTSLRDQLGRTPIASASTDTLTSMLHDNSHEVYPLDDNAINWKKWSGRVARGKALLEEGKQLLSVQSPRNPVSRGTTSGFHLRAEDEHTFLAQYASCPGLITLTSSTLLFTSLAGSTKLVIPRDRLRGVRKSGLMKGTIITWVPEELMNGEEREERFHWVGGRDELFARLVGSGGGRWTTV